MNRLKTEKIAKQIFVFFMILALLLPSTAHADAEATVNLGRTSTFAILAGQTITNTGTTSVGGDAGGNIGVYPGTAVADNGTLTISGVQHTANAVANEAQQDLVVAYNDAASRTPTLTFTSVDNQLGGQTLTSGVYAFGHATTANLSGTLILDAQGDPNAVFIFQASSDLVFASNSVVQLINGARYCRVFWVVGSSATINTGAAFVGHIFALTSIWVRTGATVQGQLLARNGEVTLDTNVITNGFCAVVDGGSPTNTPGVIPTNVPGELPTNTPSISPTNTPSTSPVIPSTGDSSRPMLWGWMSILALTGLMILVYYKKQTR